MAKKISTTSDSPVFKPGFAAFKEIRHVDDIEEVYSFKKKLGAGSYGTVWSGRFLKMGTRVAIKVICKA